MIQCLLRLNRLIKIVGVNLKFTAAVVQFNSLFDNALHTSCSDVWGVSSGHRV
jgi:hypothetical protein